MISPNGVYYAPSLHGEKTMCQWKTEILIKMDIVKMTHLKLVNLKS